MFVDKIETYSYHVEVTVLEKLCFSFCRVRVVFHVS
jgi:hypothetical protein